jgi:hypothetical protein
MTYEFEEYYDAQKAEQELIDAEYYRLRRQQVQEQASRDHVRARIEGVLRAFGIQLQIGGCGGSSEPWIKAFFPDGLAVEFENFHIDTFDALPDQKG